MEEMGKKADEEWRKWRGVREEGETECNFKNINFFMCLNNIFLNQ